MNHLAKLFLSVLALSTAFATAQSNNIPQVQHVIVVVQENRTPDNLFNQDYYLRQAGGHVQPNSNQAPACRDGGLAIPLLAAPLFTCYDTRAQPFPADAGLDQHVE